MQRGSRSIQDIAARSEPSVDPVDHGPVCHGCERSLTTSPLTSANPIGLTLSVRRSFELAAKIANQGVGRERGIVPNSEKPFAI
jgi:hypothetical protein